MPTPNRPRNAHRAIRPNFYPEWIPAGARVVAVTRTRNIHIRDTAIVYHPRRAGALHRRVVMAADRMAQAAQAYVAAAERIWPPEWATLHIERTTPEAVTLSVAPVNLSIKIIQNRRLSRRTERRIARQIGRLISLRDAWLDSLAAYPPQTGLRLSVQQSPFGALHMASDAQGEVVAFGPTLDSMMRRLVAHFEHEERSLFEPLSLIVDLNQWRSIDTDETNEEFQRRLHDRQSAREADDEAAPVDEPDPNDSDEPEIFF